MLINISIYSEPGDLGDLHDDEHGEVNSTRTFDWLTIGHQDGILGRSLAVSNCRMVSKRTL